MSLWLNSPLVLDIHTYVNIAPLPFEHKVDSKNEVIEIPLQLFPCENSSLLQIIYFLKFIFLQYPGIELSGRQRMEYEEIYIFVQNNGFIIIPFRSEKTLYEFILK